VSLVNPVLFSQRFNVSPTALDTAALLDPFLNADTKLFIDPLLLEKSAHPTIKARGLAVLRAGFSNVLDLVEVSQRVGDAAWKAAVRLLNLEETAETCLGYGGASIRGSSRPDSIRQAILSTAKEIIQLGEKNPNVIPLMGLLEAGVGPDTISDMTTNFIRPVLAEITSDFCAANGIPTRAFKEFGGAQLPENPLRPGSPVLLVPRDILRDLPFATDWSEVSSVAMEVQSIRDAVNRMFGDITKANVTEKKEAIRAATLSSLTNVRALLRAVLDATEPYDQKADNFGYYALREILRANPALFSGKAAKPPQKDQKTLEGVVHEIVAAFTEMVEDNNLWELLWHGTEPKKERAAQLLFYGVAKNICSANNIDISPETNAGGGPVDFKFSTGYHGRYLVEIKLSKGTVVHGYQKQLEVYKKASKTHQAMLLVVQVGPLGAKFRTITRLKAEAEGRGERASAIALVDARRQRSASKR